MLVCRFCHRIPSPHGLAQYGEAKGERMLFSGRHGYELFSLLIFRHHNYAGFSFGGFLRPYLQGGLKTGIYDNLSKF